MKRLLISVTILLVFCSVVYPQNQKNEVKTLFDGRLKIISLYKTQLEILENLDDLRSDARRKIIIESLYRSYKEFRERNSVPIPGRIFTP